MSINIQESFQKMPLGEKIIGGAAIVFFIDSFLPWFQKSYPAGIIGTATYHRSGWGGGGAIFTILAVLISLALLGEIIVARFTTVKLPALPQGVTWARVQLGGGIAVLLLVILRFLIGESVLTISLDPAYGIYLGIVLAIVMAVGGGLLFQAEGGLASLSGGKGGGTTGPSGPTM